MTGTIWKIARCTSGNAVPTPGRGVGENCWL
nr:MAG TPA: hypothetical protein [Caudoviricetes sp.]